MTWAEFLPLFFLAVMGLSLLAYVILDGYDLGVGLLLLQANNAEKDTMIASIGPFWDANETWLVLGVGVLLIAFPMAHGLVLQALYLPVAVMLIGLILRGVAFDFRVKAPLKYKPFWNRAFFAGSLMAVAMAGEFMSAGHDVADDADQVEQLVGGRLRSGSGDRPESLRDPWSDRPGTQAAELQGPGEHRRRQLGRSDRGHERRSRGFFLVVGGGNIYSVVPAHQGVADRVEQRQRELPAAR